jgi:hypothetical protein
MDARAAHLPLKDSFDVYGVGRAYLTSMPLLQSCHRDGPVGEQHALSRKAHPPAILHPPSSPRSTSSIPSPPCTVAFHPHLIIFPSQRILLHLQLFIRHPQLIPHPPLQSHLIICILSSSFILSCSPCSVDHPQLLIFHPQLILHPQTLRLGSRMIVHPLLMTRSIRRCLD